MLLAPPPNSTSNTLNGNISSSRGSVAYLPQKRNSLPGLDNDPDFKFDPNRVVLRFLPRLIELFLYSIPLSRRNSAINFGRLYEHFYQQLKQEVRG